MLTALSNDGVCCLSLGLLEDVFLSLMLTFFLVFSFLFGCWCLLWDLSCFGVGCALLSLLLHEHDLLQQKKLFLGKTFNDGDISMHLSWVIILWSLLHLILSGALCDDWLFSGFWLSCYVFVCFSFYCNKTFTYSIFNWYAQKSFSNLLSHLSLQSLLTQWCIFNFLKFCILLLLHFQFIWDFICLSCWRFFQDLHISFLCQDFVSLLNCC